MDQRDGTFRMVEFPSLGIGSVPSFPLHPLPKETRIAPNEHEIMQRIFEVGETLRIKGSIFKVVAIQPSGEMVLQLQPRD